MKSEFSKKPIREFGRVVTGKTPPKKVETAFGDSYPFITPRDLDGSKFVIKTERYLSEDGLASVKNNVIPPDSVLVSCIGSDMGKVALSTQKSLTNQQLNTIIVDTSKHNPEYVYYALSLEKNSLMRAAGGTTMPILNKTSFENYEIYAPDKKIQDRIVEVIKPIDEKIAHNITINQTLEKIAQRIFKSWFIDFDPVKANAEGVPFNGLSPELQALFPSEFEESELGMIPKGWAVKCILNLQEKVSKGTTPNKKDIEGATDVADVPFIKVRNISDDRQIEIELEKISRSIHENQLNRSILKKGDLLFTIAGTIGRTSIIPARLHDSNCNQAVCFIRLKDKERFNGLVYFNLNSKRVQDDISSKIVQAVQANVSLKNINDIQLVVPSDEVLDSWNEVSKPILDKMLIVQEQNIALKKIRDRLLPRLITGKIQLSDANQELKEAV